MTAILAIAFAALLFAQAVAGTHSWADVLYLVLLVILAVANAYAHKQINRKAETVKDKADAIETAVDSVRTAVADVKRATGLVKRRDDPDPSPPIPPGAAKTKRRRAADRAADRAAQAKD